MNDNEFDEYFQSRAIRFRRVANLILQDWTEAEDAVQDVFVRLYARWGSLRAVSLDAYAHRAVVNEAISRSKRLRRVQPTDEALDAEIEADEGLMSAWEMLTEATAIQRAVIALRVLEDMPVADVALALGLPQGTVKAHASRGLARIRKVGPHEY